MTPCTTSGVRAVAASWAIRSRRSPTRSVPRPRPTYPAEATSPSTNDGSESRAKKPASAASPVTRWRRHVRKVPATTGVSPTACAADASREGLDTARTVSVPHRRRCPARPQRHVLVCPHPVTGRYGGGVADSDDGLNLVPAPVDLDLFGTHLALAE